MGREGAAARQRLWPTLGLLRSSLQGPDRTSALQAPIMLLTGHGDQVRGVRRQLLVCDGQQTLAVTAFNPCS